MSDAQDDSLLKNEENKNAATVSPMAHLFNHSLYLRCQKMLAEKEKLKNKLCVLQELRNSTTQPPPSSIKREDQLSKEAIRAVGKFKSTTNKLVADLRLLMKDQERHEMQDFERNLKDVPTKINNNMTVSLLLVQILIV